MRRTAIAALGALALGGCATDNNTLIFGTNTTVGLDVSSAATEGGSPHITIGYKRAEGVWMPLRQVPAPLANGTFDSATGLYQSDNSDTGKSTRKDAYSVFASIGATFNGGAQATQAQAGAGLAQFFATGAAAVNISQNEALVTVLKVADPASSKSQAEAVTAVAKSKLDTEIAKLPPEAIAKIYSTVDAVSKSEGDRIDVITKCAADQAQWKALVETASTTQGAISDTLKSRLEAATDAASRKNLLLSEDSTVQALTAACAKTKAGG